MPWSYRPALDGLRSVAVYLVLLFHCGVSAARGGFIGVDLFFVLSGFLITNVLLSDYETTGRIRLSVFYSRRVRRLFPAAVLAVCATCVVFLLVASVVQRLPLVRDAQSALLYIANWRFMHEQNDYFASGVVRSPFLHFWSLAIEEQFYVVFPCVLLVLLRAARRWAWVPSASIALLLSLSLAAQLYWSAADPNHAYYGTDARVYQLLAGAFLACLLHARQPRRSARLADAGAIAGLGGVLALGSGLLALGVSERGLAAAATATLLIGCLAAADRGLLARLLSRRTPVYLGRVSYATYLWHWPVILVIRQLVPSLRPVELAVVAGVGATGLAALSYQVMEMPIRRSASLDRFRWPTVAAGVCVCGLIAVAVVPPVLQSSRRPQFVTAASLPRTTVPKPVSAHLAHHVGQRARVPNGLDWKALATDNGPARTCGAGSPQRCTVVTGHGIHILLLGDSHARMLAPALIQLAREHDFTLSLNVISSCPWQAQLTNLSMPPADQKECTAGRDVWYGDVLPKLRPDVVLLADYSRDDESIYGHTLVRTGGSSESLHELVRNTTFETLDRITRTGARALVVHNIITSSFDPLDCLARATYVDQCAVTAPRRPPISDTFYDAAARRSKAVFTVNIKPIACPRPPVCQPILDGMTVWRNENHFSTGLLVHFRTRVWDAIIRSGVLRGLP